MSTLYDKYMEGLRNKFGVPDGRLVTDNQAPTLPSSLGPLTKPSVHETNRIDELKQKFQLPDGLQVEGLARRKEITVEDYVKEKDREAFKGMKLAVGSTTYKGKPLRIWFTIGR
jgi:hypothetical protein